MVVSWCFLLLLKKTVLLLNYNGADNYIVCSGKLKAEFMPPSGLNKNNGLLIFYSNKLLVLRYCGAMTLCA
jgi:hypothetical protein